jgi:hypothetical protein
MKKLNNSASRNNKRDDQPQVLIVDSTNPRNEITTGTSIIINDRNRIKDNWLLLQNSDIFLNRKNNIFENGRMGNLTSSINDSREGGNNIYLTQQSPSNRIINYNTGKTRKNSLAKNEFRVYNKTEGVKDYLRKTKQLIFMNYSLKLKEDRMNRIEESYINELNSLRESMKSIEITKQSFEENFQLKHENFLRYLKDQILEENDKLDHLTEINKSLQQEVRALEQKKNKSKDLLERNYNFMFFLLSVKERWSTVPSKKDLDLLESDKGNKRLSLKNEFIIKKTLNMTNVKLTKNNSLLESCKNIYEKSSDLIEDLTFFEHNNILHLEKYNNLNLQLTQLQKDLNINDETETDNEHTKYQILKREMKIEKLKEKNSQIVKEKDNFLANKLKKEIFLNFKEKSNFFTKLLVSYKLCTDFNNSKNKKIVPKFVRLNWKFVLNSNISIEILKFVEKIFEYLYSNLQEFQISDPFYLKELEKELDLERKKKAYEDQKIEIKYKTEQLNKRILERINRITKLQGKRIMEKQPPLNSNMKKLTLVSDKEDSELDQLLQY